MSDLFPLARAGARVTTAATAGQLAVAVRRTLPRATRLTVSVDGRRVAVRPRAGQARAGAGPWRGGVLGGLWLRSTPDGSAPTDTVVQDNVLSSYREMEGARAAVAERNVIGCP